ncbi:MULTISPECIES: ATP-dependent helicase [Vibrio]|uniref:ATP-dependent helicase n=1 Tax=Vibrio TaxID=662 RepID=UPI001B811463|nr:MULTISPECIES: ATP-dependent helicase [Vibrio]BDP38328.1 DNA helicase [Vibrio alginolyticus]MDF5646552.1 ATP-dependent helicase [Vibrio parahaemolyticus]MDF5666190.1 ATP-dependent helicase [Vibrio parahaemolyticus]WKV19445.1 pcrA_2 [Vibrio parahaemolyticus]BDP33428.1 DNA helicase [Vibrio vulnificus]
MKRTSEQEAIVSFNSGNALIDAGPGTGKTTTLIEFILEQVKTMPATNMCVLMFNSDIATEFTARIKAKRLADLPLIKTFHGFCYSVLRNSGHLNRIGFELNMDTGPFQLSLARSALKVIAANTRSKKIASVIGDSKTADTLLSFVGLVKAMMLPVKEVFNIMGINQTYSFLIPAFYEFEKARMAEKVLFFDDWCPETVALLRKDGQLRTQYQSKFSKILIDEFQDINASQYELVKLIKAQNTSLIAVGDIDQSIYSWRGSNPGFMLTFEKDFPPCTKLTLSKTFRYGHRLSLASNHLIVNNQERFDTLTVSAPGTPMTNVEVCPTGTPAADVIESINKHLESGGQPADCAVLIRRWSQSMLFELSFLLRRVPYKMPPEFALPNTREIKLLTTLLTFVTGNDKVLDSEARSTLIFDLLRFPHTYVPNKKLMELSRRLSGIDVEHWVSAIDTIQLADTTSKTRYENVRERLYIIDTLKGMKNASALDVFDVYLDESNMSEWLANSATSDAELAEAEERFNSLATVLRSLKLSPADALSYFQRLINLSQQQTKNNYGVTLTTIFRSKGCEYDLVLLPFWDADTMPIKKKSETGLGVDEEEERRLAYVGMTRAKKTVRIFHAKAQEDEHHLTKASKFIRESEIDLSIALCNAVTERTELPERSTPTSLRYHEAMVAQR